MITQLDPNDPLSTYNDDVDYNDATHQQMLCGWAPHPEDVEAILKTLPAPLFGDAAPHLAGTWDGKSDIKLWDACIKVTGANLPADKQTIGDCVSHGHARGIDYLQCVQIALNKANINEFVEGKESAMSEGLYGNMRKRAGQLSYSDGASGIWAVDSLLKDGCPVRNGKPYDGSLAKSYGAKGTPDAIYQSGVSRLLKQYILVKTPDEAADLLSNGYPITICSNQGFTMKRDADGICEASGSWSHCMLIIGMLMTAGVRTFVILQSWGQNTPSGPVTRNMPDNSFCCRESAFTRILNARDSYGLTSIPGFPSQDIMNFYV
jgi:hypothetical protein